MNETLDRIDIRDQRGVLMYRVNTAKMRPIPGFPGYFATSTGGVLTTGLGGCGLGNGHPYPLVLRRHKPDKDYLSTCLTVRSAGRSESKDVAVHRLVCLAFHGLPASGRDHVRHLNGVPQDNRACNLAWGSIQENYDDSVRHGTALGLRKGQRHPASKLSDEDVPLIRGFHAVGCSLRAIADHFGVTKECIRSVVNRLAWQHVPGVQQPAEPLLVNPSRRRRGLSKAAA